MVNKISFFEIFFPNGALKIIPAPGDFGAPANFAIRANFLLSISFTMPSLSDKTSKVKSPFLGILKSP